MSAFYRTVTFSLKPEQAQGFKDLMCEMLPDARTFEGCQHLSMLADRADPAKVMLYMIWDTEENYTAYMAWRKETGFGPTIAPYLAAPPAGEDYTLIQD